MQWQQIFGLRKVVAYYLMEKRSAPWLTTLKRLTLNRLFIYIFFWVLKSYQIFPTMDITWCNPLPGILLLFSDWWVAYWTCLSHQMELPLLDPRESPTCPTRIACMDPHYCCYECLHCIFTSHFPAANAKGYPWRDGSSNGSTFNAFNWSWPARRMNWMQLLRTTQQLYSAPTVCQQS